MTKVYVVRETTYDRDFIDIATPLALGMIGVFDSKDLAAKVMHDEMVKLGMPSCNYNELDNDYVIPVDYNRRYVNVVASPNSVKFWMAFSIKECEMNKILNWVAN